MSDESNNNNENNNSAYNNKCIVHLFRFYCMNHAMFYTGRVQEVRINCTKALAGAELACWLAARLRLARLIEATLLAHNFAFRACYAPSRHKQFPASAPLLPLAMVYPRQNYFGLSCFAWHKVRCVRGTRKCEVSRQNMQLIILVNSIQIDGTVLLATSRSNNSILSPEL